MNMSVTDILVILVAFCLIAYPLINSFYLFLTRNRFFDTLLVQGEAFDYCLMKTLRELEKQYGSNRKN